MSIFNLKQPRTKQAEVAECLLSCFALCAEISGHYHNMQAYRNLYPYFQNGGTFQDIHQICNDMKVGFKAYASPDLLAENVEHPVIAQIYNSHFIVVEKITKHKVLISDPELGRYHCSIAEFSEMYSGFFAILDFSENVIDEKIPSYDATIALKLGTISTSTKIRIFLYSLVFNAAAIGGIYLVGDSINANSVSNFWWSITGFIILNIIAVWVLTIKNLMIVNMSQGSIESAKNIMLENLAKKSFTFHSSRHLSSIMTAFNSVEQAIEVKVMSFDRLLLSALFVLLTVIVALFVHIELGFVLLVGTSLSVLIRLSASNVLRDKASQFSLNRGREYSHVIGVLRGINSLRFMGLAKGVLNVSFDIFRKTRLSRKRYLRLIEIVQSLQLQLKIFEFALIIILAQILVDPSEIGTLYTILLLRYFIDLKLGDLLPAFEATISNVALLDRLDAILQAPSEENVALARPELKPALRASQGSVLFQARDASFGFHRENMIVQDLSFSINRGSFTVIVGETGAGKSTLMAMLMGLLPVQRGEIYFDGDVLNGKARSKLMAHSACVLQKEGLFAATIDENVAGLTRAYNPADVSIALKNASIFDEIMQLPMQNRTIIREDGSNLSSGQMQRLMLARAFYFDPEIYFLDEGTSHLDPITEDKLLRAIKISGKTVVFVSHSERVLDFADQIIDLRSET